jgi:transcriptional regulator GlxA family with amidase domain
MNSARAPRTVKLQIRTGSAERASRGSGSNDGSGAAAGQLARTVVLLAFDGCQSLDVCGPFEVFNSANVRKSKFAPGYRPIIASRDGGNVHANSGLIIAGTIAIADLPRHIDTALVAGGDEAAALALGNDPAVASWMKGISRQARRYGSICTGAFALGAMGLLDGRRVATHWESCEALATRFPRALVDTNALYVEDSGLHSSAGVTAGMDMALALVEADLGRQVAFAVARHLVLFLRRSGGHPQLSTALIAQELSSDRVRDLLVWIVEHPETRLTMCALADRLSISERTVTRHFREQTGMTPMEFILTVRLDHARRLLERTDWPVDRVAAKSGFGSSDALHRAFVRELHSTPGDYRRRCHAA